MKYQILCAIITILLNRSICSSKLKEYYYWNVMDFQYPNETLHEQAIEAGELIPENNLPVGMEIWNDKLFITVPRWRNGIPSTLNYVPLNSKSKSPLLIPYPNIEFNRFGDCSNALSSVYRIRADSCDRLWVYDAGTFGVANTSTVVCPYAINVFNLRTDKRLRRYEFRSEDTNPNTFIANIAVDLGKNCDDAYAYLSDGLGYGLIVYSWKQNTSWRFEHNFFLPDPLAGDFNVGGINFQWGDEGIFGITLSPLESDGCRTLYFSPLASTREFAVSTRILRNSSNVGNSFHQFHALEDRGPHGHVTTKFMDEDGVMFFNLLDVNGIGCWNSENEYDSKNLEILATDDEKLIFPNDVKVDRYRNIWVMSDRLSNYLINGLDNDDVNFRIFTSSVYSLIENTRCDQH